MNDATLRAKRLALLNVLDVTPINREIAERGGELRRLHNLALPDALIAACAEHAGGQFFSKDPHFKRLLEAGILSGAVYDE
ncbi:MAG: PIN domain-containing protein [Chloroflexi bacterium]|nr:PIN domain-containing protein [Chloroflexota bacterium]